MASPTNQPAEAQPDKRGLGWIIGLVVALLALAGWMGWEVYPGLAGNFWPTTEGTVRSLKMFYKAKSIDDVNTPKNFSVELQYEYKVNGTTYTGTAYNTTNNNLTPAEAEDVKQKLQPGAKCTVYYSPLFPVNSVINPAMTVSAWGKLVIGVLALLGAVVVTVFVVRESISPRPNP